MQPSHHRRLCAESRTSASSFRPPSPATSARSESTGPRTTTPTLPRASGPQVPSRFRSFASLPRLDRFVLGISRSTVQSKPLTCWEVYADASGLRGVDTTSHVTPRWRRRGSWFWLVASEEPRRFLLSGRRGRSAWLVPAAARSPALGVCPGPGLLLPRWVRGSPGDLAAGVLRRPPEEEADGGTRPPRSSVPAEFRGLRALQELHL